MRPSCTCALVPQASVHGNITCKSLKIDPTTVIVGSINVNPFAPSKVDPLGNIVEDSEVRTTSKRPSIHVL